MKTNLCILFSLLAIAAKSQTFTDSDIPIVIIDTYNQTIVDQPKITSHFKLIYNGPNIRNYVTDIPNYEGEMGIEIRGTYSQTFPQQSYEIELRDAFGAQVDTGLLGMPAEHDWCLITTYNDKAFSRNTLASDLFMHMGYYAPRMRFCEVVVNGDYRGIYLLSEKIKRDHNRVHIAKLDSTEVTYPNVSGGYILENGYWTSSNSWQTNYGPVDHPTFDVHLVYHYPKPDDIQPAQETYIQGFINQFETALYGPNFADPVTGYRAYADDLSFADFFIIQELSRNYDGFMHSVYFNKDKDANGTSKLFCGPVWDFDWAFNSIYVSNCTDFAAQDGSGWAYKINDCNIHSVNSTGWHVRMLQDTTFANLLHCRWDQLRQTILDTAYIFHHIDSVAAYLNEAQARHYARWGHLATNVGGCHVPPIPTTFAGHVQQLKDRIAVRAAWLDANMPGSSANCTLGTTEINENFSAIVFPNPCNENAYIETNGFGKEITVTCYDADGRVALENSFANKENFTLDVSSLSSGVYMLEIKDENGNLAHRKLLVTH